MHSSLNEWNERNRTSILFEISQRNALTIIVLVQTIQLYTKWLRGYQLSSGKFIRFLFFFDMCATVGLNVGSYNKHLATCHIQFLKKILFHQKHDTNLIYILLVKCSFCWVPSRFTYNKILKDIKLFLLHSYKNIDCFKMIRYSHVIRWQMIGSLENKWQNISWLWRYPVYHALTYLHVFCNLQWLARGIK